jgi:molybdenum cofactor cytidylyltransferase
MIAAVILAAGTSSRMGSAKALLAYPLEDGGETSFAEHLVDVFDRAGAAPVVVVLGHDADRVRAAIDGRRARTVDNPRYREGMLSSIRAGIGALDDPAIEGALVCPVDHPDVAPSLVELLVRRFEETRAPVVLPVASGRRGHPVLFSRAVFRELLEAPDGVGARQVVWDHEKDLLEVRVSQPGVRVDLDRPEEYQRWLRERRSRLAR